MSETKTDEVAEAVVEVVKEPISKPNLVIVGAIVAAGATAYFLYRRAKASKKVDVTVTTTVEAPIEGADEPLDSSI